MADRLNLKKPLITPKMLVNTYEAVYSGGVKYPREGTQAISLIRQLYELYVGVVEVRNHEIGGVKMSTIEIPISKAAGHSKPYLEMLVLNMQQSAKCPFLIVSDAEMVCLSWHHTDFEDASLFLSKQLKRLDYARGITQGNRLLMDDPRVQESAERIIRVIGFPETIKICSSSLLTGILIVEFTLSPVKNVQRSEYMRTKVRDAFDGHCRDFSIRKTPGLPSFRVAIHL